MKKIYALLLIVIIMMGVSGCMNNDIVEKTKTTSDDLVSYMNDKYDDKFTYKEPFGGGVGATTKQIIVSSKKYPDYDIWVEYSYEDNRYYDNYIDYKYKKEYEECLSKEIVDALTCESVVRREIATSGSYTDFDRDVTFDEYMNTNKQTSDFTAVIKNVDFSSKEKIEEKLSNVFDKYSSSFYGNIYFINADENIESFFELDISSIDQHENVFVTKTNEGATSYEWR